MSGKLSDAKIKNLKPGPKLTKYADGGGLTLVVTPSGGKNWWFRYRFEGKEQTLSLGTYPVVTLLEARERHLAAKRELEAGRSPAAVKQAQKVAAMTFEQAAADFLTSRREHGYAEQAIDDIQGRLKKHVFPALGTRPLGEITARDILEVLLAIRRLGIEETARRCRQYVSQVFQFAIVRGWADRNPAADLQGIPELRKTAQARHQRAVKTPAELGRLLLDIETISDTLAGKALELAPYVFVRAGELAGARWAEVDMASSLWRIPAERMKAKGEHIVPLARQVKERLEALTARAAFSQLTSAGTNQAVLGLGRAARLAGSRFKYELLDGFPVFAGSASLGSPPAAATPATGGPTCGPGPFTTPAPSTAGAVSPARTRISPA